MNTPSYFADAESSLDDAAVVLFGVPYGKTSSFRFGAHQAPWAIRQASWNFETFNFISGKDLKDILFHDYGDLEVEDDTPRDMVQKTTAFVTTLLKKKKFPLAVGGEHAITPGIVHAFPQDISVVSIDAHLDFRQRYEGEPYNHACVVRRLADHIPLDNIAVLGVRSAEKEEFEEAKKQGLFFVDAFTIHEKGIAYALQKTQHHLKQKKIYFTLDIDGIDPAYAPGTSTPEPFGLTPFDILACIDCFASSLVGFDVVEVCPPYDNGETALLAAKFIRHIIEHVGPRSFNK